MLKASLKSRQHTNTDVAPLEVMVCYKQLTSSGSFEQAFFATHQIFQSRRDNSQLRACSFVSLVLTALEDRISNLGRLGLWPEILANLDQLTETEVMQDGKGLMSRFALRPHASRALREQHYPGTDCPSGGRGPIPAFINHPKYSANPAFRCGFARALQIRTIEDQQDNK